MFSIIDFHTHTFPDELAPRAIAQLLENAPVDTIYTDGTAQGLKQSMHKSGITLSVTLPVATKKEQVPVINQQQAAADRSFIIPFGSLHPHTDNAVDEIAYLVDNNIRGIKMHPEYQNFYIDDPQYFPLYEALSSAGLITLFHAGKDFTPFTGDHALPRAFIAVRRNFPSLKIVAAHMGGWKLWEEVALELSGQSLYFDTSAVYGLLSKDLFMKIARKHGTDHLLFGSDSPWFDQAKAVEWIDSLPLTSSEKENIFTLNARRLLNL